MLQYDLWYPIPTDRYGSARASPSFVGSLLITETVGSPGNASIASVSIPNAPDLAAYAVWDGKSLSRIALLNLAHRNVTSPSNQGAVRVDLSKIVKGRNATVKRMTAPGMDSKDSNATTWAGQSFVNGTASGEEAIEGLENNAVEVNGSEGVLVFL
jgi:hypothetical protein